MSQKLDAPRPRKLEDEVQLPAVNHHLELVRVLQLQSKSRTSCLEGLKQDYPAQPVHFIIGPYKVLVVSLDLDAVLVHYRQGQNLLVEYQASAAV